MTMEDSSVRESAATTGTTCGKPLRASKACSRPSGHKGQHRTARAMANRNRQKRADTRQATLERELAGIPDGRKTRTKKGEDFAREYRAASEPQDDYYARKLAAGLID